MSSIAKITISRSVGLALSFLDDSTGKANLYDVLKAIRDGFGNRLITGGHVLAPTTPSTQATGAGATAWRVNVEALRAKVGNVMFGAAVAADTVIHSATQLVADGQSCVAAIVLKNVAGTVSMVSVKGAAATTGAQVAPTDAAIQAAVGVGNAWVKIAECTINRTADTTVTQTQDTSKADVGEEFIIGG